MIHDPRKFDSGVPGGRGVEIHWDRDEKARCPACAGVATRPMVSCAYCDSEGLVSHRRADIIERQLASKTSPRIGGGQEA